LPLFSFKKKKSVKGIKKTEALETSVELSMSQAKQPALYKQPKRGFVLKTALLSPDAITLYHIKIICQYLFRNFSKIFYIFLLQRLFACDIMILYVIKNTYPERRYTDMESQNIVTLIDEEGTEMRFEVLDVIEYEGTDYAVLIPDNEEADSVIILRVDVDENGNESLDTEHDEKILDAVFAIFVENNKDEFDFVD